MTELDAVEAVKTAIETSEVINCSRTIKASAEGAQKLALDKAKVKPVSDSQIADLEKNGCTAESWSKIKVADGFDASRVKNVAFFGTVVLGAFTGSVKVAKGTELPSGIYRSTVADCCIGNDVLVSDVKLLANYVVRERAILFNVGEIITSSETEFGNGKELSIAIETGGRETKVYAEITVAVAEKIGRSRADKDMLAAYGKAVDEYMKAVKCRIGTIDVGATIKNTARVSDTYVGSCAEIDSASVVVNSTILSNEEEAVEITAGAFVNSSVLQWGCEVTTMAIVDKAVLTEHSHVERHGKVTESIVGPNSGVAEGEVTASLLGPFVGFHHQALLIAAFWPEGKGNVGYGANVGSNHTSKAPDQEIWPGEGAFFGLGVNVKFPSDFTKAPYIILASGVSTLPQRVTFPFSLINSSARVIEGISPAYNEISPAWVLADNMFTLKRNEGKYKKRNKARRTEFVFDVFRPDTVDLMLDGRQRLVDVQQQKDIYTDKDIKGLGKNYMLEPSRKKAVETYTFYIRYYALLGLKKKVAKIVEKGQTDMLSALLSSPSDDAIWEHERKILQDELPENDITANLKLLRDMLDKIARDVEVSKEKDDIRGAKVIGDYPTAHPPAAEDDFVQTTWKETRQAQAEIDGLLTHSR